MAEKVDFGPRLGCDPEFFIIAKKGEGSQEPKKNTIIPACGLFGGTKNAPRIVETNSSLSNYVNVSEAGRHGKFGYLEDNVMFEFNMPAARTAEMFSNNVSGYLQYLEEEVLAPKNLMFSWINKYKFNEKALAHPFAQTIGCDPDFDAYQPEGKQARQAFGIRQLGQNRFCGGHLHVQYNTNNVPRHVFARYMDLCVGLPFLAVDKQAERREFYGKAGLFRPKTYGVEYRTPSNFWACGRNEAKKRSDGGKAYLVSRQIAYNALNLAHQANKNPTLLADAFRQIPWNDVKRAIDEENVALAQDIIRHVFGANRMLDFGVYYHNGQHFTSI